MGLAQESTDYALLLLNAAPLTIEYAADGIKLSWANDALVTNLLGCPLNRIPRTYQDLESWIGKRAQNLRQAAIHSMQGPGERYRVSYQTRTFDGAIIWIEESGEWVNSGSEHSDGKHSKMISAVLTDMTRERHADMRQAHISRSQDISHDKQNFSTQPLIVDKATLVLALENKTFTLAYQPIIEAVSGEVSHYESLLRFIKEDGTLISAFPFILAAEKFDYITEIDLFALEQASLQLIENPHLELAVNISTQTLCTPAHAETYLKALEGLGDACQRLILEVTETLVMDETSAMLTFIQTAHRIGCRVAIDDFGSGHTLFRHIFALKADMLKIDGLIADGVATDQHQQMVVRVIVDLASTFNISTIAEKVNNPEDASVLKQLGIDYFQGYMFGEPALLPKPSQAVSA